MSRLLRIEDNMEQTTETRLSVHEAVCAERYKQIQESFDRVDARFQDGNSKFRRLEYIMYAVMEAVLLGPGAAATFFKKLIGL